jgi:acetyl esterase/lipase
MKEYKLILVLCLVLTINYASAQVCTQDDRYTYTEYFTSTQIDSLKNVTYGNAVDYLGEEQELKMDLYFPNNDQDAMEKRPFILLIHGGGFMGGHREGFIYHAQELSKRGFVVATMSYRLGFDPEIMSDVQNAVYRAQQDANTALRYIAAEAENLKIDTSWVFIGGSSAGALTSLMTSYAIQAEWNQVTTQFEVNLGPLNPPGKEMNDLVTIKGIYNFMGAIHPMVLSTGELIPTISFHGDLDKRVPIGKSPITGLGSKLIHEMLNEAGVCNDFTIIAGGTHGILRSQKDVDFRINRVANFFSSLMCDTCISNTATIEN